MNQTKIILALLAIAFVFPSCRKAYHCHCTLDRSNIQNIPQTFYVIKARNRDKAAIECSSHNNAQVDKVCVLE